MGDYLKDIMAKKRQLNEKIQSNWTADQRQTTKPTNNSTTTDTTNSNTIKNTSTNTKNKNFRKATMEEFAAYEMKRDRLEDKRVDRKEHRTEVNKGLSEYENEKHELRDQEFQGETTLRDRYEAQWRAQEYLYEKTKRERAQARRERAAELAQRPSQYVQEVAQKQKEDEDEESRVEKWATVYQSRTTEDARQLGKAIARIQFQQVLENEGGDGGGDPDHDDDFQRVQLRRRRHQQGPKAVAPRDIDNNESHQLSTWYHSKSLARQGVAPPPSSSSSSSSSTSTRDYSRYLGRYDDDDDEGSGGEATTTTHGDMEEKDAETKAEISTD